MNILGLVDALPAPVQRGLLAAVNANDPFRHWLSRRVINNYAYATALRPRSLSMAADYPTWPGLTDRRFSGRHIACRDSADEPAQPDIEKVVKLFIREEFTPATDTSLLFAFFAQWFVDGFLRTKWEEGPERRFRENESNHEIDLCQIYGIGETQAAMLREGRGGRLRMQTLHGEEWPAPLFEERDGKWQLKPVFERRPEKDENTPAVPGLYSSANFARVFRSWTDEEKSHAFAVGLEHGNSTLGHALMNTLFFREHNRTARILAAAHSDWDDERLFQTARNTTIVVLLNIVVSDYIVHIAPIPVKLAIRPGMAEKERWYRTNWIPVEFALLYRWHDLIPDKLSLDGEDIRSDRFRHANGLLIKHGLDKVLLAAAAERAGRIGLGNTARFLVDPAQQGGADVKRLSIAMGRACRLPGFNAYRRHYGLEPYGSFEELTQDRETAERLRVLYGDIDRLEWFVGIFAEAHGENDMMGELLLKMVANDAFTQALTNPLLAEAVYTPETFGPEGHEIVRTTDTLAQVIVRNTGIADPALVRFETRHPLTRSRYGQARRRGAGLAGGGELRPR